MQNFLVQCINREVEWRLLRSDTLPTQLSVVDPPSIVNEEVVVKQFSKCVAEEESTESPTPSAARVLPSVEEKRTLKPNEMKHPTTLFVAAESIVKETGTESSTPAADEKLDLVLFTTVELFGKKVTVVMPCEE